MLDFTGVKAITIPEGRVKKITRKSDGVVLWKGGYKNLVDIATAEIGGTELYGGVGYKNGYRWSSSKKAEDASYKYARLTGWIPYVYGGLLRLKNFGLDKGSGYASGGYLVIRWQDGTYSTRNLEWQSEDYLERELTEGNVTHFRISAQCSKNNTGTPLIDPPIVTIDEEII